MDQATIARILERQGAPDTPENVNRIIQAAASDPTILERYSLGTAPAQMQVGPTGMRDIRGGTGLNDNAALLNLAQADTPEQIARVAAPSAPQPSAPVRRAAPTARRPGIPGDYNAPVGAPPFPKAATPPGQAYEPSTGAPMPVPSGAAESRLHPPDEGTPSGTGGPGMDWLLALLGLRALPKSTGSAPLPPPFQQGGLPAQTGPRAVAPTGPNAQYAGRVPLGGGVTDVEDLNARRLGMTDPRAAGYMQPQLQGPRAQLPYNPQSPTSAAPPPAQLPPSTTPQYPSGATEIPKGAAQEAARRAQNPADVERLRAEVEGERFQQRMLQEEMARQNAARANTQATVDAARESQRPKNPVRPGARPRVGR